MYDSIASDKDVMGGEPCIEGRRVSVRQIAEMVEDRGDHPSEVAYRFGLDAEEVYEALAYYHRNPREFERIRAKRKNSEEDSDMVSSPDDLASSVEG